MLNHIGVDGYTESCRKIVSAARDFSRIIREEFAADLYVLGDPRVSVVAFSSKTLNVYALGDLMSKKGWHLNALANPPALHMAFTVRPFQPNCLSLSLLRPGTHLRHR